MRNRKFIPSLGYALLIVAWIVPIVPLICLSYMSTSVTDRMVKWEILLLSPLFGVATALLLLYQSEKLSKLAKRLICAKRPTAAEVELLLARDTRPLVLYFRSFWDEEVTGKVHGAEVGDEDDVYEVARKIGPMVVIGRPGERLPPLGLGVIRTYLRDEDWQEHVRNYLERARLIFITPDFTSGLVWETTKAFQICGPEKIVITLGVLEKKGLSTYERFRKEVIRTTERAIVLPIDVPVHGYIWFDSDGGANITEGSALESVLKKQGLEFGSPRTLLMEKADQMVGSVHWVIILILMSYLWVLPLVCLPFWMYEYFRREPDT